MKRLLNTIVAFFQLLYGKLSGNLTSTELDFINDELDKAIAENTIKKVLIKREVRQFMFKKYGYRQSLFIPSRSVNKTEVYESIQNKFGDRLLELNVTLTRNLTWI